MHHRQDLGHLLHFVDDDNPLIRIPFQQHFQSFRFCGKPTMHIKIKQVYPKASREMMLQPSGLSGPTRPEKKEAA
ncbi:MAG: hypothetical protein ACNA71_09760 [Kiritimatiellia bacterium]